MGLAAALVVGLGAFPAFSYIQRVIQLKDFISDSEIIVTVKVESLDPAKPSMVLKVDKSLKGKAPFGTLTVDLTGDHEQGKWPSAELLKRLAPNLPLVIFCNPKGTAQARFKYHAFLYSNGTWFQMFAADGADPDALPWKYRHCEPYFRRVFKGTTDELKQTVVDALEGKRQPPAYDPNEKEGIGPEVQAEGKKNGP